jgi:hypothetical protein
MQVRDPDGFEAHRSSLLNHSISIRAVAVAGKSHEEDQMSTTEKITSAPTSAAPPALICATPGCKNALSYNNRSGICSQCFAKKSKGITEQQRAAAAPNRAKSHGAHHHDPAHANGNGKSNGNGNGAQPAAEKLLLMPRVDSRVDLLLAAVPQADKAKMLTLWLAGTL